MPDEVLTGFLETAARLARGLSSRCEALESFDADARSGDPPSRYSGIFSGIEHYQCSESGVYAVSEAPIPFSIEFPSDYLKSVDRTLQFRVARIHAPVAHPNLNAGMLCLGERFQPGTPLEALVERVYLIVSSRVYATAGPLDRKASDYYLGHREDVRALRARPLWRAAADAGARP